MRFSLAMLMCLLTSMQATSESPDFAIYRLTGDERILLAEGPRNYYKKLQGEGYVRVTQADHEDGVEIQSVEFLSDITLRFMEDVKEETGKKTHEVVVSQGSVFKFPHRELADTLADGIKCQARAAAREAQVNRQAH